MYYSSVNRGLSLTSPGKYTFALTLILGVIAMASGLNAIFLTVSFLMAALIMSGVLSERVMKTVRIRGGAEYRVQASIPFQIEFAIDTDEKFPGLAGLECQVHGVTPRMKYLSELKGALGTASKICLMPNRSEVFSVFLDGLARGKRSELPVVLTTTFPFGILHKFRIEHLPVNLTVFPKMHTAFENHLRSQLGLFRNRAEDRESFFSHRMYRSQDSIRMVDWKKSAGRDVPYWVTKEYEGGAPTKSFVIDPGWNHLRSFANEQNYETFLSVIATAIVLLSSEKQDVGLLLTDGTVEGDTQKALDILAGAPSFSNLETWVVSVGGGTLSHEDSSVIAIMDFREFFE